MSSGDAPTKSLTRVLSAAPRLWDAIQIASVIGGLTVLFLLQIPWLNDPLAKLGISDSESLRMAIVALVLAAVFVEVHEVARGMSQFDRSPRKHFPHIVDMYPFMTLRAATIRSVDARRMDVLGTTLHTAWPQLFYWLQKSEASNWTVRLAAIGESASTAPWIPDDWPDEASLNAAGIQNAERSRELERRGIHLEIYRYQFLPVIRGFRLGNGDLFISFLSWGDDGRLSRRGFSYEYVPHDEDTPSAEALRDLFDSWFSRALVAV